MSPRSIRRSAATVLVLAGILALLPSVAAGTPAPLDFNPAGLNNPGTDVGVDDEGLLSGAVVQANPTDSDPTGDLNQDDLYLYRLEDETEHNSFNRENLTTEAYSQLVAVPTADENGAETFAVAGPEGWIVTFDQSNGQVISTQFSEFRATDLAISGDGRYIAAAMDKVDTARSGKLIVLEANKAAGNYGGPHQVDIDSLPTTTAISPQGAGDDALVAVGTEHNGWTVYFDNRVADGTTSFSRDTNEVSDIAMSGHGRYITVGVRENAGGAAGAVYLYGGTEATKPYGNSYDQYLARFNSPRASVEDVAITEDGTYFAAGTDDGRIRFFENTRPDTTDSHQAVAQGTWSHPDGATVQDLDVSNDGLYYVAAVGGDMWGFTRGGEVLWTVDDVRGRVAEVDVSGDGSRFVAVSNDGGQGFAYGWEHNRDLEVEVDPQTPTVEPRETVSVDVNATNKGSNVDTFTFLISPPSNWGYEPDTVTRRILPGQSTNFTLNITPQRLEREGFYPTKIRVSSEDTGDVVQEAFVNSTIPRVDDINITTKNKSVQVDAGNERIVPFEVDNNGNGKAYVNVSEIKQSHSTGEAWDVEVREWDRDSPIRIDRGATATLTLSIRPPADAVDGDYNRITVVLDSGGNTDTLNVTARINPQFDFSAQLTTTSLEIEPGESRQVELIVQNRGNTLDVIRINNTTTPSDAREHWDVRVPPGRGNLTLGQGQTKSVQIGVAPAVEEPDPVTVTFTLSSRGPIEQEINLELRPPPDDDDNDIPGPGLLSAVAAVAAAAGFRRRLRSGGPPGG